MTAGRCASTRAASADGSRTVSRSARTIAAPHSSGVWISRTWMSKETVVTATRRSPGARASTSDCMCRKLARASCGTTTPLGRPVEPVGLAGRTRGVDHVRRVGAGQRGEPVGVADGAGRERGQRGEGVGGVQHDPLGAGGVGSEGGAVQGGEHAHRPGVVHHEAEPVRRVFEVQRQVGAARLEHREERHDQVGAAGQGQADEGLGGDAPRDQQAGQPVGPRVQLRVVEDGVPGDHGGQRAVAARGLLEGGHDGAGRYGTVGVADGGDGRRQRGGGEQIGPADRGLRAGLGAGLKEVGELGEERCRRVLVVGVGVGVQLQPDPALGLVVVDAEGQVVHGAGGDVVHGGGRPGEVQAVVEGLDVEHGAEGAGTLRAAGTQLAADVLGAVVLVAAQPAHPGGHVGDQFAERDPRPHGDPQRQHVDHHGRDAQRRGSQAGHGRQGQHHVTGTAGPVQPGGERGGHRVGPAGPHRPGGGQQQAGRPGTELGVRTQERVRRGVRGAAQRGRLGQLRQPLPPVRPVRRVALGAEVGGLLVEDGRQAGEGGGAGLAALGERRVDLGGAPGDEGEPVGVEGDVVDPLVPEGPVRGDPVQAEAVERVLRRVRRGGHVTAHQGQRGAVRVVLPGVVEDRDGHRPGVRTGAGQLVRLPVGVLGEGDGQRLALGDGAAQRRGEQLGVQGALDLDVLADVEDRGLRVEPLAVPDAGLGPGEGETLGGAVAHGWCSSGRRRDRDGGRPGV